MSLAPRPDMSATLLAPDEPHPLETVNLEGGADFVLICEHAGRRIPAVLGDMGLSEEDRRRHIAWDVGARDIAIALSRILDAPLFMQRYSRLVCDCNRRTDVPSFMPVISELTEIPANNDISAAERQARIDEIYTPFHDAITAALDARDAAGKPTLLVTVHSFTPVFKGVSRPWQIGVLFNRDRDFAPQVARYIQNNTDYTVGINEPYAVSDESDYAMPVHGEARGYPCVEFEIRNDLTAGDEAVEAWAQLMAASVLHAKEAFSLSQRKAV
ncbi:N-formylglutamate amidohydrolase [Tianweitania sediminis]|uniref:N-formylglutamate amidohydrolase n=1 Tax=Tianweitania sediminis TaxID=1502156 RepID=A0A8J7UKS9_9HYPH|nr:N-formylglutamate amidohydrolase [Tianweitania sediminis]MBP0438652.1 N-formylglutamate amidohydrolase [Tianweitania sediminis]HEV7415637.1 N-formylglutamate amidohydrolase [Tianweitania sediminis]